MKDSKINAPININANNVSKNKTPKKKPRRKSGKRGYRLHDERIAYSGGTGSCRSIKYELLNPDATRKNLLRGSGLQHEIISAVRQDNLLLYGPLNFNDYIFDKDAPNLLHFWTLALSLGFVFSNQNSIEREFKDYLGVSTEEAVLFGKLNETLKAVFDEAKFISGFLYRNFRGLASKTREQRIKLLTDTLREPLDGVNGDSVSEIIKPYAEKWAEYDGECDQFVFKCELFSIKSTDKPRENTRLSFAIDPAFEVMKLDDKTVFFDDLITHYKENCSDEAQAKRFLGIGDNGNYFNGIFGGLFELLTDGDEKICETTDHLARIYGFDETKKTEINKRLVRLAEYARQINRRPCLVKRWSEYRSDFNGTIESWYSNRQSKQNDTLKQLDEKLKLLEEMRASFPTDSDLCGIKSLSETIEFIRSLKGERIARKVTDELESYLAVLGSELNQYTQQNKDHALPLGWQKKLSKHIQSSPLFFGENKIALWEKLINLKELIKTEVKELEVVLAEDFDDYEITDKQVDNLAALAGRFSESPDGSGHPLVTERLAKIESTLGVDFTHKNNRAKFYLSGFERGKFGKLDVPNKIKVSHLFELADLSILYNAVANSPEDGYILRDTAQLSKIILSAKLRDADREKQRKTVLAHSTLQGYSALISKREFVSRYPLQAVNGSQNLMAYDANRKYYYAYNSEKFAGTKELTVALRGNNFGPEAFGGKFKKVPALRVQSSKYQIQFLDWFFEKQKKRKTELGAGGSFTIAEISCKVNWDDKTPVIFEKPDPRLFVSQPFTINPPENSAKKDYARYIGIDIGEYGLAWHLVEVFEDANEDIGGAGKNAVRIKSVEKGFFTDPQQISLKEDVKKLRENQVRATFTSPDTKIARVRESLIGSYRNLLEDLAVRKDARLCFEYEVSGFESGGARISKVYDSIKRSSVAKKENKAENKQSWGKLFGPEFSFKAIEITAAGTSQYCTKCKRWASLAIKDNNNYQLLEWDNGETGDKRGSDGLLAVTLDGEGKETNRTVRLFPKDGKKAGDTIKGKDLKSAIYRAMRPNMRPSEDGSISLGAGMEAVRRDLMPEQWEKLTLEFGQGKPRGNMAIYVCPYCGHISDADMQAAFNIAVRGYLANRDKEKKVKLGKEYLTDEQSKLTFDPVGILEHTT